MAFAYWKDKVACQWQILVKWVFWVRLAYLLIYYRILGNKNRVSIAAHPVLNVTRITSSSLMLQGGVCSCQARNRYAEGAAAYIVIADHVAELDGGWVTTMLAADTNFEVVAGRASIIYCHLHQATHTIPIELLEGILG